MRGRWIKIVPATSAPCAVKKDKKDKVFDIEILEDEDDLLAMKVLEDEDDLLAMKDQRGDTKYTYKVSIGVSRKSCCVFCRLEQCH